ncbi:MAG: metallophosphoesterase [Isosphaeraceae bacterium]
MSVWAISDLHLSHARPMPREQFALRWRDHATRIAQQWREVVRRDDLVLLPGDLSMARNHREVQPDLEWLESLPGTKLLTPGNHDVWWNGVAKVSPLLRKSQRAVCGNAIELSGVVVCGAQGYDPNAEDDNLAHKNRVSRESQLLESALDRAATLRNPGVPLYILWHYPPFDRHGRAAPCVQQFEAAGATAVVYGHLHTVSQWSRAVNGVVNGVRYACVAADAIGFRPLRIDGSRR